MQKNAPDWIEEKEAGVLLHLLVLPKSSRSEVVGLFGNPPRLKIKIAAPPVDGEANLELFRFLKKLLGIGISQLSLVKGERSKTKDVFCQGLSYDHAKTVLFKPN